VPEPDGQASETCFTSRVAQSRARPTAAERRTAARERRTAAIAAIGDGLPVVAIVGYPNVGKSTLFNRLTGRREAVVNAQPGVTRDRREVSADWRGRAFQLIDTGGIDEEDPTPIGRQVAAQAVRAIEEADLILFVIDAQSGAAAGDLDVADRLRRAKKPVLVVANKCDDERHEADAQALWGLGLGEVVPVSAQHGRGAGDLLDMIVERLPRAPDLNLDAEAPPAIAILGRPNVGKSSLLNAILGEDRVIVHDAPGTTRDPVDTVIDVDGRRVVLTDTAGLRKRGKAGEAVERYSHLRAVQSADRSDVALVVCDATEGITDADLAAAETAAHAHCATLIVMNKWDLAQPDLDHLNGYVRAKVRQRPPIEVSSAVTGEGVDRLIPAALRLHSRLSERISTKRLNTELRRLAEERPGPRRGNKRLSLRYLVQTGVSPPTFRLDVNDKGLLTRDYVFWLENRFRRALDLDGIHMVIEVHERR
jgi:GTP-binding protein